MAERLLDDQPCPAFSRAALADRLHDGREDDRRRREVVDAVPASTALLVELGERPGEVVLSLLIGEVQRYVAHAVGEQLPDVVSKVVPRVLLHRLLHPLLEVLVGLLGASGPDDGEVLRQEPAERKRVERRKELPLRQVAGGAEDHEDARVGRAPNLETLEERVVLEGRGRHGRGLWNIRDALVTVPGTGTCLCWPWRGALRITVGPGSPSRARRLSRHARRTGSAAPPPPWPRTSSRRGRRSGRTTTRRSRARARSRRSPR